MTDLPYSEACERNKGPILERLSGIVRPGQRVLEIGSGTGQHAVHFAAELEVLWQASDVPANLPPLARRIELAGLENLPPPLALDVHGDWPEEHAWEGVFSANTAHIMGWGGVVRMFRGVAQALAADGWFALYGPFNYDGEFTSEGNRRLDAWAKSLNPASGIRDFEAIRDLAEASGLAFVADHEMPANNRLLTFSRV